MIKELLLLVYYASKFSIVKKTVTFALKDGDGTRDVVGVLSQHRCNCCYDSGITNG